MTFSVSMCFYIKVHLPHIKHRELMLVFKFFFKLFIKSICLKPDRAGFSTKYVEENVIKTWLRNLSLTQSTFQTHMLLKLYFFQKRNKNERLG